MYLSYEEYTEYGGTLDETAFQDLEFDAESTVNWYTFNRLKRPEWAYVLETEELKRCVYQIIQIRQIENEIMASGLGGEGGGIAWKKEAGITQESNDGVSTSYNVPSSGQIMSYFNRTRTKKSIILRYLGSIVNDLGRNILYKGVYPGE